MRSFARKFELFRTVRPTSGRLKASAEFQDSSRGFRRNRRMIRSRRNNRSINVEVVARSVVLSFFFGFDESQRPDKCAQQFKVLDVRVRGKRAESCSLRRSVNLTL